VLEAVLGVLRAQEKAARESPVETGNRTNSF
jgi:hypothetical protein